MLRICTTYRERLLSVADINDYNLFGSVESIDIPSPLLQATFQSTDNPCLVQNGIHSIVYTYIG